jgi:hypothetical protein
MRKSTTRRENAKFAEKSKSSHHPEIAKPELKWWNPVK